MAPISRTRRIAVLLGLLLVGILVVRHYQAVDPDLTCGQYSHVNKREAVTNALKREKRLTTPVAVDLALVRVQLYCYTHDSNSKIRSVT